MFESFLVAGASASIVSFCSAKGGNEIGRHVVSPRRIGARSRGLCPGACTVLSAKVYYVTDIICFGKSWNIPWWPGRTPSAPPPQRTQGYVLPHPCVGQVSGRPVYPVPRTIPEFP